MGEHPVRLSVTGDHRRSRLTVFFRLLPEPLHRFLSAYVRYSYHLNAYVTLAANPFPGFTGTPGSYPIDVELPPAVDQRRLVTAFRVFLAIPAIAVSGALNPPS